MKPLAKTGEVPANDFALLYDRVEMGESRPQLYGTQATCQAGKWTIWPIVDPEHVEDRRKQLALPETAAQIAQRMAALPPCVLDPDR